MDLTTSFYIVAACAVCLTGISKGGFGGGLGIMSVPLMTLYVPPQFAVAVLMPVLLLMDTLIVCRYRHRWSREIVLMLLPGAAAGLIIGGLTFRWMNADMIRFAIGLLALTFVALYIVGQIRKRPAAATPVATVFALGAVSGFGSFVAHAGGPPVKGILLRQNLGKSVFVGTNTMFFFVLNAVKTVAYGALGQYSAESLRVSLFMVPVLVIGIGLGIALHRFVSQSLFNRLVYGFLTLAGLKLLYDSSGAVWAGLISSSGLG